MQLLQGKEVSQKIRAQLQIKVEEFKSRVGRAPRLDVVIVGDDKASHIYVKNKHLACEQIGMLSTVHQLSAKTTEEDVLKLIKNLNQDSKVDGVLVQMPVPQHISTEKILNTISPDKDADGLTSLSAGRMWSGQAGVRPCTPKGVMHILEHYKISVKGKKAVVVGRSQIVGKPMAAMLLEKDATVFICHSKTENLEEITRQGDVVVVAAGVPKLLGRSAFKQGAVVIDVGIHGSGTGQICGDVRTEELDGWVLAATPVPGGVGPMTITCLLENTLWLAERRSR